MEKGRIFISYKRDDKDVVFKIKDDIEKHVGEKCWIDLYGIESNAQFVGEITEAIDACEVFIFMHSKEHNKIIDINKDWTIREVNYALEEKKNIVVVNIDNVLLGQNPFSKWYKFMFPNKQEIDATDPEKLERFYEDLCSWLKEDLDIDRKRELLNELPNEMFEFNDFYCVKDEKYLGIQIVGYVSSSFVMQIPDEIVYNDFHYPVTSIGKEAFYQLRTLNSVTIPKNIRYIGESAFSRCSSLKTIEIPDGIISIEPSTFSHCKSLVSVSLPDSLQIIGHHAFYECKSLKSISLPSRIYEIEKFAFAHCESLCSIVIPENVTKISGTALSSCSSLSSIIVDECNLVYDSRYNCNAIIESSTNALIVGCGISVIPEGVITIKRGAFYDCNSLVFIQIPESVNTIEYNAFAYCRRLNSMIIPKGVSYIEGSAFSNCSSLVFVSIPNTVTCVGEKIFAKCISLHSIYIPQGKKKMFEQILGVSNKKYWQYLIETDKFN